MKQTDRIFIAGHNGMVGSSLYKLLKKNQFQNLIVADRKKLDLLNQIDTRNFFKENNIDCLVIAAAKVGGIKANMTYPADFLYNNLQIQNNLINEAVNSGVKKIIFLGSSCIYPAKCLQPMKEEYLLTGPLEPTNEGYAIAKIAGLKMLEYYNLQYGVNVLSLMPCNLYGPNDSFDLEHSHVLSALVKKVIDAIDNNLNEVVIWGSGIARREFMHVDDLAEAILFFSNKFENHSFFNVGWGTDISIKELALLIGKIANYKGEFIWDTSKPDGMIKKCMDVSLMQEYGFTPKINLEKGIEQMIKLYNKNK
ncbi:MAG: GDP-L-fucose synthase [Lutibacter sp.]|nr:GDP-L-fucose synthase [Lutibacter sp.]